MSLAEEGFPYRFPIYFGKVRKTPFKGGSVVVDSLNASQAQLSWEHPIKRLRRIRDGR